MGALPQAPGMLAVGLNGTGYYIHWGFIQLSLANLIVIALMVVAFIAALFLPFPGHGSHASGAGGAGRAAHATSPSQEERS